VASSDAVMGSADVGHAASMDTSDSTQRLALEQALTWPLPVGNLDDREAMRRHFYRIGAVLLGKERAVRIRDNPDWHSGSPPSQPAQGSRAEGQEGELWLQKSVGLVLQAALWNRPAMVSRKLGSAMSLRICDGTFSKDVWATCNSFRTVSMSIWAKRSSIVA
jgi:hypothetical protein